MIRLVLVLFSVIVHGGCSAPEPLVPSHRVSLDAVPIQWGAGGEHKATFVIDDDQWTAIEGHFDPPPVDAHDERRRIADAIGHFERIAGTQTPTHRDLARNQINPAGPGRLDCIDESTNSTTYLVLLHQHGLIQHHDLMTRSFRAPQIIDSHFGAVIRERITGDLFVVDSWFRDNGAPAVIQRYEHWMRKDPPPQLPE